MKNRRIYQATTCVVNYAVSADRGNLYAAGNSTSYRERPIHFFLAGECYTRLPNHMLPVIVNAERRASPVDETI